MFVYPDVSISFLFCSVSDPSKNPYIYYPTMVLDSTVWGPHYWFFLHTVAETYPDHPNNIMKRKYYDLIQNMALFIPDVEMGNKFAEYLDRYPVTPYLDNRDSFVRWVHFIHNKFNVLLGKEEISIRAALDMYEAEYKPKPVYMYETVKIRRQYLHIILFLLCVFLIYVFY